MFAFEGCLTILMFVYVIFLGFIKLLDTRLPIGTLDILNIMCMLFVVKTYTTNSKIGRRLDTLKVSAEKCFKENNRIICEGFRDMEKKRLGECVQTGITMKNLSNSVSSLNGLVTSRGSIEQERLGRRHSLGLEIC